MSGRDPAVRWVLLVYFAGGACALIDEVVWVRLLKLTLGNTVYAGSVVVSTFMAGLALGAWLMGRRAAGVARPLRLYALLEVAATAAALAVPLLLRLVDGGWRWLWARWEPPPAALLLLQVVVSALVLLVPAMLMGSTLPLLGRYIAAEAGRVGALVGRLYAINMLGAALGCFLAGFVLLRALGVTGTLLVAGGLNLLVALAGWRLSLRHELRPSATGATRREPQGVPPSLVLAASFGSGLVSLGYELVWMRSLAIPLGGFTYVFSAVLTVYLVGNVLGAALGSRLARHGARPAASFGWSLLLLGLLGLLFVPWLATWQRELAPALPAWASFGLPPAMGRPLVWATALALVPSVAMGLGFPLALEAVSRGLREAGAATGALYAVNTAGAVLGGALAGFVLVPHLGAQATLTVLGLVGLGMGGLLAAAGATRRLVPVGAALVAAVLPLVVPSDLYLRAVVDRPPALTLDVEEGTTSTVSARQRPDGTRLLLSDGVNIAGDDIHRVAQNVLGHLGVLLHGTARDVLSIGFGSGETTLCLAQHDVTIQCVEIAPELVRLALRHFAHINLGPRLDERVELVYMDARNFLHLTPGSWDLIVNDADIPAFSGSAPLFTREHFENARAHLRPGGLFMTKLHVGGLAMSRATFDSILGTFLEVFPQVTAWFPITRPVSFFYLVGSDAPQRWPVERLRAAVARPGVAAGLRLLNVRDEQDLLTCYVGDQDDLALWLGEWRPNTDDRPFVEFNTDVEEFDEQALHPLLFEFIEASGGESLARHLEIPAGEAPGWWSSFEALRQAARQVVHATGATGNMARLAALEAGLRLAPDHPALLELLDQALDGAERAGEALLGTLDDQVRADGTAALPWLVRARLLRGRGDLPGALEAAGHALERAPGNPRALDETASILLARGEAAAALARVEEALALAPDLARLHGRRAAALAALGRDEAALPEWQREAELSPTDAEARRALGEALAAAGRGGEAIEAYREAVRLAPDWPAALRELAWLLATHPDAARRSPAEAVRLAERACELTERRGWKPFDALGAACAAAGRFDEAVAAARQALALAPPAESDAVRARLLLYQSRAPFVAGGETP